jgi:hypothetical protein
VVRIPSFSQRSRAATRDEDGDGRIDARDDRMAADRFDDGQAHDSQTYRGRATADSSDDVDRAEAERVAAADRARMADDRTGSGHVVEHDGRHPLDRHDLHDDDRTVAVDRDGDGAADAVATDRDRDGVPDRTLPPTPVVAGPRPRASMLATIGLILGVVAAVMVLTGTLAAYGIGVGVLGLLASLGGFSATSRRHVAGKSDSMIGLLLSVGAIVIGSLVLTGAMIWTADTDQVGRLREWLDTNIADRF